MKNLENSEYTVANFSDATVYQNPGGSSLPLPTYLSISSTPNYLKERLRGSEETRASFALSSLDVDFCEKRVKTALFTVATFTSLFLPAALGMSYFWVWFLGVFLILQHFPFIFGPLLQ